MRRFFKFGCKRVKDLSKKTHTVGIIKKQRLKSIRCAKFMTRPCEIGNVSDRLLDIEVTKIVQKKRY